MINILLIIAIIVIGLSGALVYAKNHVQELGASLFQDASSSYENVVDKTNEVIDDFKTTKAKVEETAADVQNAWEKVEEAKQAVSEITK